MSLYLVQQPRTLESMAVEKLGDWIASQAEQMLSSIAELQQRGAAGAVLSRQIDVIRNHLEYHVPRVLHDNLAVETIRALNSLLDEIKKSAPEKRMHRIIIGRMTQTLFTKNLTSLLLDSDLNHVEMFYALSLKSNMLSNLVKLHLGAINDYIDLEDDMIPFLKELRNLRYLFLHSTFFSDYILTCIAENCQLIEVLDSDESFNYYIDDSTTDILSRLPNLRSVDLYESRISEKGIANLLLSCKNIEYIHLKCQNKIYQAIKYIESLEGSPVKLLKWNCYEPYYRESIEDLQPFFKMCPLIQKLVLHQAHPKNSLAFYHNLQHLRELELHRFNFYSDQLTELLQRTGNNVVEIRLFNIHEMDINALTCIGQTCPLENLSLIQCVFVEESLENDLLQCKIDKSEVPLFGNLKSLTLENSSHRELTEGQLFFLLSNCPNVEYIHTKSISLSHDFLLKVLDKNPLVHLIKLRLSFMRHEIDKTIPNMAIITQYYLNTPEVLFDVYNWC